MAERDAVKPALKKRCADAYLLEKVKGEQPFGFIPHPDIRGMWMRVHPCVVLIKCSACGAEPGDPCTSRKGKTWSSSHHYVRRMDKFDRREFDKSADREKVIVVKYGP